MTNRRPIGHPKEKYSPKISHDPAPRKLWGEPVWIDNSKRANYTIRLRTEYPKARITQCKTGVEALAITKWPNHGDMVTHCMRCGKKMVDRRSEVYDPQLKKWRLHLQFGDDKGKENWECTKCAPNIGGQPTVAFLSLLVSSSTED